ncbi:hypothetical protein BDZ89DRAFT_600102 [Hymenopellis radicata]|nr:hypothetical protein BDZ89DRAFT_600102 [Hymenopellis radicata]
MYSMNTATLSLNFCYFGITNVPTEGTRRLALDPAFIRVVTREVQFARTACCFTRVYSEQVSFDGDCPHIHLCSWNTQTVHGTGMIQTCDIYRRVIPHYTAQARRILSQPCIIGSDGQTFVEARVNVGPLPSEDNLVTVWRTPPPKTLAKGIWTRVFSASRLQCSIYFITRP